MDVHRGALRFTAVLCSVLLAIGDPALIAQTPPAAPAPATDAAQVIPPDQLDSLVAPIALYPDPLLAQVLAASTYPLEIVQLQQWLEKHKDLKDKALADAVQKENWDPSVQAMAGLPDVVKLLADNIKWTSELGNAFLAQQSAIMDAVQRMRAKAKDKGQLKSTEQVKVETKVVESKDVVVIQQANPQVIYVPSYDPVVVYGAPPPVYAYPPVVYPPAWHYAAGAAISFGVGVAMGAMWSGGWGYNCGWGGGGHNDITINNNNNFNRNTNRTNNIGNGSGNRAGAAGNGNRSGQWQHNPQHRGGAPYGDRATASKFGGTTRGDSTSARQTSARQNQATRGDRNAGADRGAASDRNAGANRGAGSDRSSADRSGAGSDRSSSSADRVGNRQVSGSDRSSGGSFSGAGKSSGSQARSSSSRGSSSVGGSRGGGSRGGGGRRR